MTKRMEAGRQLQQVMLAMALGMMLVLLVALAGCGGGGSQQEDPSENFIGTWELSDFTEASASSSGDSIDLDLLKSFGYTITLTLDEDKSMKMEMAGESMEGTWEVKDSSTITITSDEASGEATLQDGNLILEEDGDRMVFERSADSSSSSDAS